MNSKYILLILLLSFNACSSKKNPLFITSEDLPTYKQSSFSEYTQITRSWLSANRVFSTDNHELELDMHSPFELQPLAQENPSKGILLVHGLGDSPAYFHDLADELALQGFLVRAISLPGHGSRPADMMLPKFADWAGVVQHHVELLQKSVEEVWLGGFSTGANLVTSYALEHEDEIAGLVLFSPGFFPSEKDLKSLPFAWIGKYIRPWYSQSETNENIMRYESLPMNGVALYYKSSKEVQKLFEEKTFDKPVFLAVSQDDNTINPEPIPDLFIKIFTNPASRLVWYGDTVEPANEQFISMPSYLPEERIASFSHIGLLFSPDHPVYGKNSSYRMYDNGQDTEFTGQDSELWFSAGGHKKEGIYCARLTWNPYFEETSNIIKQVLEAK